MSPQTCEKELVEEFVVAAFEKDDRRTVRRMLADDFVDHDPKLPADERGPDGFERHVLDVLHGAFPDLSLAIESLIAEDGEVVCRYTMTGTHEGPFRGIEPSGNTVVVTGMAQFRLANDGVTDLWRTTDSLELLEQIGVLGHDHDRDADTR